MNLPAAVNESSPFSFRSAARFWEARRLLYNLVLTGVALFWFLKAWSHFRPALSWSLLGILVILAMLANLCYCAAYLADLAIQHLLAGSARSRCRWAVWSLGTLCAILLESYWINDEIYPGLSQAAHLFLGR